MPLVDTVKLALPPAVIVTELGCVVIVGTSTVVEVAATDADPLAYPLRVVTIVAVELVAGATPVTVTMPTLLIVTAPEAVAVPDQV